MNKILKSFSQLGVREAERGEFSKRYYRICPQFIITIFIRALINGKMSLTEVEGLADLLDAETTLQLKISQQNINVIFIIYI